MASVPPAGRDVGSLLPSVPWVLPMSTPAATGSGDLTVRTRRSFHSPAAAVWPLLCSSRMSGSVHPWFKLGVPLPQECRLPAGHGGVGSERECVSDQGVVHQRILEWSPEAHLTFRMERTDLSYRRFVREMVESFDLVPTPRGVEVTRTTRVWVHGRPSRTRKWMLSLGIRRVHRFVFRNWERLASGTAA
jgi:hypothetical protein